MDSGTPKRILVVDDETDLTHFLTLLIARRTGHEVEQAASGLQAMRFIKERDFHLVITDIHMPGMNGLEVLREVKALNPDIEVIMLTGQGTLDSAVDALQMQAYDYIEKPVNADRLIQTVKNALAQQALSAELTSTIQQVADLNRELKRQVREATAVRLPIERTATAGVLLDYLERQIGAPLTGAPVFQRLRAGLERRRPVRGPVDLKELTRVQVAELSAIYPHVEVAVDLTSDPVVITGESAALAQAVRIILQNAVQAMQGSGALAVGARVAEGWAFLRVRDRGPGFTGGSMSELEEPLAGGSGGTGLGLHIVKRTMSDHAGTMTLANAPDGGAIVTLRLPMV